VLAAAAATPDNASMPTFIQWDVADQDRSGRLGADGSTATKHPERVIDAEGR
jgi:hypothetical protein